MKGLLKYRMMRCKCLWTTKFAPTRSSVIGLVLYLGGEAKCNNHLPLLPSCACSADGVSRTTCDSECIDSLSDEILL